MTDTLDEAEPVNDVSLQETDAAQTDETSQPEPARYCQLPECPNTLPPGSHARTRYCAEHDGKTPERRRIRREWLRDHGITDGPDMRQTAPSDEAPRIAVGIGAGGKPPKGAGATAAELAAVEARARQIAQVVAALVLLGGKNDTRRLADAKDIAEGTPALATSLRDLAQYEPWLRKLGAGGEVSDRAQAWGAVLLAAGVMVTPILVRHEVIKGSMAELAATILANGESLGPAATE